LTSPQEARGERIAVHLRSSGNGKHTTVPDHMPSSHRRYADWTIGRIRRDAALIGPATAALCELILEHRPHPEQGFRSCLGILRRNAPSLFEALHPNHHHAGAEPIAFSSLTPRSLTNRWESPRFKPSEICYSVLLVFGTPLPA